MKGKGKKYKCHSLPIGAMLVPLDSNNKGKVKDWRFHHQGWKLEEQTQFRSGATQGNMFPPSR